MLRRGPFPSYLRLRAASRSFQNVCENAYIRFFPLPARGLIPAVVFLFAPGCFPGGGFFQKGGFVDQVQVFSEATRTGQSPYSIVCRDRDEIKRRAEMVERGETPPTDPPLILKNPAEYKGGCEEEGETSRFYMLHLWPVTPPLDPAYAMGRPVQELEGDTMINVRAWHETHYYSILGHVRLYRVRGDVIRFNTTEKK